MKRVKFIDHLKDCSKKEKLQIKIAKWLREKEYLFPASSYLHLADRIGVAWELFDSQEQDHPEMPNAVGILRIMLGCPQDFIGTIVIGKNATIYWKDASATHWILEAYGKEYVEYLKRIAEKMAKDFNVDISIHLIREFPRKGFLIKPKNVKLEDK